MNDSNVTTLKHVFKHRIPKNEYFHTNKTHQKKKQKKITHTERERGKKMQTNKRIKIYTFE